MAPSCPCVLQRKGLILLLLKPCRSGRIQPGEGRPEAGSTPGSSPFPTGAPCHAAPTPVPVPALCCPSLLPVPQEQSRQAGRQEQAGQHQAQPFPHHGLPEGPWPSPLSQSSTFGIKIHVHGFSHAPDPKDTFSHLSPCPGRGAQLGCTPPPRHWLIQAGLWHRPLYMWITKAPVPSCHTLLPAKTNCSHLHNGETEAQPWTLHEQQHGWDFNPPPPFPTDSNHLTVSLQLCL